MKNEIPGIHHVTAIASDPQRNINFYTDVLGLRLVKLTVNFDDPGTYHFYYGDEEGQPGTILTFFPWPGARRGQRGVGQAAVTSFSVPEGSLAFWQERLAEFGVTTGQRKRRFDEEALSLLDPDWMQLELVAHAEAAEIPPWDGGTVAAEFAIRGFHSVTLWEANPEPTATLLTDVLGFQPGEEAGPRFRFRATGKGPGAVVDLLDYPDGQRGWGGAGTVHHVAWRTINDEQQEAWRRRIADRGLHVTPVMDRQYFRSIYFREPGGVLFEIATDPPGFGRDESPAELGTSLMLPPWLEPNRTRVEAALPKVVLPGTGSRERAA